MADKADNSFCKFNRSVTRRCCVCQWPFRCPVEQLHRDTCSACQSIADEIMREATDALHPST